jgi:hypothetical protein
MVKTLFWVAVGAAGALQGERVVSKLRTRVSPRFVTDGLLDKVNARLESQRRKDVPAPGL